MLKRTYRRRKRSLTRFQWDCRHLLSRAVAWGILSYAFVRVYGALYGANPAIVHRLGMTLVVICVGGAILFGGLFVGSKLAETVTEWQYNGYRGWTYYGSE